MRVMGDSGEGGGLFRVYCDGEVRKWLAPFVEVHCNEGFWGGCSTNREKFSNGFLVACVAEVI